MTNTNKQNWREAIINWNKRVKKLIDVSLKQSATNLKQLKLNFTKRGSIIFHDEKYGTNKYAIELTKRAAKTNPKLLVESFNKYIKEIQKPDSSAGQSYWDIFRYKSTEWLGGNGLFKIYKVNPTKEEKEKFWSKEDSEMKGSRTKEKKDKPLSRGEQFKSWLDTYIKGLDQNKAFGRIGQKKHIEEFKTEATKEAFTNKEVFSALGKTHSKDKEVSESANKTLGYLMEDIYKGQKALRKKKAKKGAQAAAGVLGEVAGTLQAAWERSYR